MRQLVIAAALVAAAVAAQAQMTPVGVWKTYDDDTKAEKSLVRISEQGGAMVGKVEKIYDATKQDAVCDKCDDDRKGKPVLGMQIIDGMKANGDVWDGGRVLDPNNGKVYKGRLKPVDDGKKLELRGYFGPFFRTQTWARVE